MKGIKQIAGKFNPVRSFRNTCIVAGSMLGAAVANAADSAVVEGAKTGITNAQAGGESVGAQVVICVAALVVVTIVVAMIRKA